MRQLRRWASLGRVWDYLSGNTAAPRPRPSRLGLEALETREVLDATVVYSGTSTWTNDFFGGTALLDVTVSRENSTYYWDYVVTNVDYTGDWAPVPGLDGWYINLPSGASMTPVSVPTGWNSQVNGSSYSWFSSTQASRLDVGDSAEFKFSTPIVPIASVDATVVGPVGIIDSITATVGPGVPVPATVTVTKLNDTAEGSAAPGTFQFTRTGDTSAPLTVSYSVSPSSTAAAGTDYTALSGTVTFAAGSATANVTVSAKIDAAIEGSETVVVTLGTGTGYTVGSPSSATVTIADVAPGAISGSVWQDSNGDGVQSGGEPALAGVTVTLLDAAGAPAKDANGNTVAAVTTSSTGTYSLSTLFPTGYTLNFVPPTNYTLTTAQQVTVTPGAGQTVTAPATGAVAYGTVSGKVSTGANGTGTGVAGALVTLNDANGDMVGRAVTDSSGNYQIANVPPGSRALTFVAPQYYTFAGSGTENYSQMVTVTSGATVTAQVQAVGAGRVRGTVADSSAAGVAWVKVELLNAQSTVLRTAVTGAAGTYEFGALPVGAYTVRFTAPGAYLFAASGLATWSTSASSVAGSDSLVNATANQPAGTVSGIAWVDADNDGQSTQDAPLAGVAVTLRNASGVQIGTTQTTSATGAYQFTGLAAGTYTVHFAAPAGFVAAATGLATRDVSVTVPTNSSGRADLSLYDPADVTGTVWADADNDGVQDSGESGLANVVVTLKDATGATVGSPVTTTANGTYSFTGLAPGAYTVVVAAPQNYRVGVLDQSTADFGARVTSGVDVALPVAARANQNQNPTLSVESRKLGDFAAQAKNVPATKRALELYKNGGFDFTTANIANDKVKVIPGADGQGFPLALFLVPYSFKTVNAGQGDSVIQSVTIEKTAFDNQKQEIKKYSEKIQYVEGFEIINGATAIDGHGGAAPVGGGIDRYVVKHTMVAYIGKYKDGQNAPAGIAAGTWGKILGQGAEAFNNIVPAANTNKVEISITFEYTAAGKYKVISQDLKIDYAN